MCIVSTVKIIKLFKQFFNIHNVCNYFDVCAGDPRLNQHFGITTYTIIFTRFHNYLVDRFRQLNPKWTGERLYQEARRFIAAANQIMIYRDYLPILLGTTCVSNVRLYSLKYILFYIFDYIFIIFFAETICLSCKILCGPSKFTGFKITWFQFFCTVTTLYIY